MDGGKRSFFNCMLLIYAIWIQCAGEFIAYSLQGCFPGSRAFIYVYRNEIRRVDCWENLFSTVMRYIYFFLRQFVLCGVENPIFSVFQEVTNLFHRIPGSDPIFFSPGESRRKTRIDIWGRRNLFYPLFCPLNMRFRADKSEY